MNITRNVIKLDCTKGSYVYAVKSDSGITLIDTCFPGKGEKILSEMQRYGIQPKDIKHILLTHGDSDHIGNIAYLAEKCGCDVYASEEEISYIKGEKKSGGFRGILGSFMKTKLPSTITKLHVGILDGIEIVAAPGHTPGHVCFKYENVLFAGDLLRSSNGALTLSSPIFTWDKEKAIVSCKNLNLAGMDWICPAHGEPVQMPSAWEKFEKRYLK